MYRIEFVSVQGPLELKRFDTEDQAAAALVESGFEGFVVDSKTGTRVGYKGAFAPYRTYSSAES